MRDDVDIGVWSSELRRGVIELCIMALLKNHEMYGYEIAKRLRVITREVLSVEEGTLYPLLKRLEDKGWLSFEWKIVDGRPRKYYYLTELGEVALEKMSFHWNILVKEVNKILGGVKNG